MIYKFMDVPKIRLVETVRQYGEYGKDGQLVRIPAPLDQKTLPNTASDLIPDK